MAAAVITAEAETARRTAPAARAGERKDTRELLSGETVNVNRESPLRGERAERGNAAVIPAFPAVIPVAAILNKTV